jgi:hypothetical protein
VASRADRALTAWRSLERACLRRVERGAVVVLERPGRRALAPLWPVSQVLAAAIDVADLTDVDEAVERTVLGLRRYAAGDGFVPEPGHRRRYYDDNAWIGLCFAQLHLQTGEDRWLRRARKVFRFVREGQDPDGGMRWVEGRRARHTCSAAPAAQLALRLHLADGADETLDFARRTLGWLDATLRMRGGLYADHVDRRGRVERSLWTYNQGTAAGAQWLLHVATGDEDAISRAQQTAASSLRRFGDERTWRHPPVFNAVWFRNLLALDAAAGVDVDGALDAYLARAWRNGRDADGLFTAGGIGTYDGTPAIDTAGVVQLLALRAWPRERLTIVC